MRGVDNFIRRIHSVDERGLVTCLFPSMCIEGIGCCIPFVLGEECQGCDLNHSIEAKEYHATPRPCLYSDADVEMLRSCNRDVEELLRERDHLVLWDTPELLRFRDQLLLFDATWNPNQIRYVSIFLLACGGRWRDKVQLLELFFRRNRRNTWLTAYRLTISIRPRLQAIQQMMPGGYRENFERLREAGVITLEK